MKKALRPGKVFVDWSQNSSTKTTVAIYSLRARSAPTASTPLRWEEVEATMDSGKPEDLRFTSGDVLARVKTQTQTVLNTLDAAETRSRAMGRALKTVEALPQDRAQALLPSDLTDPTDAGSA